MATTITQRATVITTMILGYSTRRKSGNVVHPIIDRGAPDITFAPAGLRTGTLRFLAGDQAEALANEALHTTAGTITLADTDLPAVGMNYVATGDIGLELDDETLNAWVVSVDFQEVA